MSRDYAAIYTSIWSDPDWRALTRHQQHCYWMLVSQPKLSPCGVLDYIPGRMANLASDLTRVEVERVVSDLCMTRPRPFLVHDEETSELLVRSFVRHDSLIKGERPAKAIAKDFSAIISGTIRQAVVDELRAHRKTHPGLKGWGGIAEQDADLMALLEQPTRPDLRAAS